MPKPPKLYFSDDETQRLIDEYRPYLDRLYVPADAARGVIRALLDRIQARNLNRQAAEDDLMANLLHDNKVLDDARMRSEDYAIDDEQSPENAARAEAFLASVSLSGLGPGRVKKVLEQYSHHSSDQMRAESDEVLKAIQADPISNYNTLSGWANVNLPQILKSLKSKHCCSSNCACNTDWPPAERVLPKDNDAGAYGAASVKNCILAYFHGLTVSSVRNYLEGQNPKV